MSRTLRRIVPALVLLLMAQQGLRAEGVPAEAMAKAAAATKVLGDQVLRANFSYTIQRMYPRWKKRAAKQYGSEEKLAEALAQLPEQMKRDGIAILSFRVGEPVSGFPVPQYGEWLVFVPTTKVYIVPDPDTGKNRRIESQGYQIAVSEQGKDDWYFIDGSNLSVRELRSIFPSLPAEEEKLNLPKVDQKELK